MWKNTTQNRRKILVASVLLVVALLGLAGRLTFFMLVQSEYYSKKADDLHVRERKIKAKRGRIVDRNGVVLADNKNVCNISVIHSQIEEKEQVIQVLCQELGLSEEYVTKRVEKISSIEKIKNNVPIEVGNRIREHQLAGIKVDTDYKRYYPYGELASKVLGFTGGDNQGIIGLEVKYEDLLKGEPGLILTTTDAKGIEVEEKGEFRIEPVTGNTLVTSLDWNIQQYATQIAKQVMETKEAERVSIIVMNPQNGEIYSMVDVPEFDLNDPYALPQTVAEDTVDTVEDTGKILNQIWRNGCINDTYEPGSIFKIITTAAALEEKLVTVEEGFGCPGFIMVEDRRIRCHKIQGHGSQTFAEALKNSCNPVFITLGLRLGVQKYYHYFKEYGLLEKTGIDLPGEAGTIMHKMENMGPVELATVSFGQSFQITPIQMATCVSSFVNGGKKVVPHVAVKAVNEEGKTVVDLSPGKGKQVISSQVSQTLRSLLEQVVEKGTGSNGGVEGFRVGGKTATSQTLPRGSGRYIASFLGFAPADNPNVLALAVIHNPKGVYYGGQVAAPVVRQLFENILPYLERM